MMRALRIIGVTIFILSLWHLLVVLTDLPAFILPSPARVGMALVGLLLVIRLLGFVYCTQYSIWPPLGTLESPKIG